MTFSAFSSTYTIKVVSSIVSSWDEIPSAGVDAAAVLRYRDRLLDKFIIIMLHSRAIINALHLLRYPIF